MEAEQQRRCRMEERLQERAATVLRGLNDEYATAVGECDVSSAFDHFVLTSNPSIHVDTDAKSSITILRLKAKLGMYLKEKYQLDI